MDESAYTIIQWDWKEQPDIEAINDAINAVADTGNRPKAFRVETESDEYAIVITDSEATQEEAQALYEDGR